MADDTKRIPYVLKEPIQIGSETITQLEFRPLRAKDLRGLPLRMDRWEHTLEIAGKLCGRADDVIDRLGAADIAGVSDIINGFLDPGPPNGVAG